MAINYSYIKFNKVSSNNIKQGYKNRGMILENDINMSNDYYRVKNIAHVYKKPTPIKLVKVDYTKNRIDEGYFLTPSTTDYNGIYKGRYIDFEAKETNSKTSFSLSNIHEHQIKHLIDVKNHGAISFLIVRFNILDETFYLSTEMLESFIKSEKRKSIPLSFFKEYGKIIDVKYEPRLDYLKVIDEIYFGGK